MAHRERCLALRPDPLGTVGGATRDSGGLVEEDREGTPLVCVTRRPERCRSRMLPAIR